MRVPLTFETCFLLQCSRAFFPISFQKSRRKDNTVSSVEVTIFKFTMKVEDVKVIYVLFRVLSDFHKTGIPCEYCCGINEVKYIIRTNTQYRIIFVCKAQDIKEIGDIIGSDYIDKICIFGNCTKLNIGNKEVILVKTDRQELMFELIRSAIDYIHHEEMVQRRLSADEIADERASDIVHLRGQVDTFLF